MSCVVGIVDKNDIWIGTDSRASTDDGMIRYSNISKVFKNSIYTIAYVGNVRSGQVLYPHYFEPPKNIFLLPDAIRETLKEKGAICSSEEGTEITNSNYLIACSSGLYEILSDFQLNKIDDYCAIGGGADVAYGSLYTTSLNKRMSPEKRILVALQTATNFCVTCGPPYIIKRVEKC